MQRTTHPRTTPGLLLFMQAALFAVMSLESAVAVAFSGPPALISTALTSALGVWILWLGRRADRGGPTRSTTVTESALLLWAAVDTGLALFVAGRLLEPVPLVTRVALPVAILWSTRRARRTPPPLPRSVSLPTLPLELQEATR
ncbi:MAG: hypothetical protein OEO77_02250 [Acidimicrobiia bacterium]|nr:hypothetical protein [Acidimicrobiia bacterium]